MHDLCWYQIGTDKPHAEQTHHGSIPLPQHFSIILYALTFLPAEVVSEVPSIVAYILYIFNKILLFLLPACLVLLFLLIESVVLIHPDCCLSKLIFLY